MSTIFNVYSAQNTLEAIQTNNFVNSIDIYNAVSLFIALPYGPGAEDRYNSAVAAVLEYQDCIQSKFGKDIVIRNVGTNTDGTVWIDTSKGNKNKNTYANFLNKIINENHNTRPSYPEAILNGSGFEIKQSASTGKNQARRTLRIGSSRVLAFGVLGTSIEEA